MYGRTEFCPSTLMIRSTSLKGTIQSFWAVCSMMFRDEAESLHQAMDMATDMATGMDMDTDMGNTEDMAGMEDMENMGAMKACGHIITEKNLIRNKRVMK